MFREQLRQQPNLVLRLWLWILAGDAIVLLLYVVSRVFRDQLGTGELMWNFDLDQEANVPTWWSAMKLALLAGSAFVYHEWRRSTGRGSVWWAVVAGFGLAWLSFDEGYRGHERVGEWLAQTSGSGLVKPALAVVLVAGIGVLWAFAWREIKRVPNVIGVAAAGVGLFLFGAVGIDAFDPLMPTMTPIRRAAVSLEEGFEMLGVTVLLYAAWLLLASVPTTPVAVAKPRPVRRADAPSAPVVALARQRDPSH